MRSKKIQCLKNRVCENKRGVGIQETASHDYKTTERTKIGCHKTTIYTEAC